MANKNDRKMTFDEYAKIWSIATYIQIIFSLLIALTTAKPHYLLLILVPSILLPIWIAINAARSQVKNFVQKRKVNNDPLLALSETLNDVYHLLPEDAKEKCIEVKSVVDDLSKLSTNELSGELLVFIESARTILIEYNSKATVLSKISDEKSNEIGMKVITQIQNKLNTLVNNWVDNTTDDLETSVVSWSETLTSVKCLTFEEENELNAAIEENAMEKENV